LRLPRLRHRRAFRRHPGAFRGSGDAGRRLLGSVAAFDPELRAGAAAGPADGGGLGGQASPLSLAHRRRGGAPRLARGLRSRRRAWAETGPRMKQSPLKLSSGNVNGVRAAHRKGLLGWMGKAKPDVLCLQETKAMPEQLSKELLEVDAYQAHWHSAEQKGYSGVGTYAAQEPKEVERGLWIERSEREGRVLVHKFK